MSDLENETLQAPPDDALPVPVLVTDPSETERPTVPLVKELVPDTVRPLVISLSEIILSVAIAEMLSVT